MKKTPTYEHRYVERRAYSWEGDYVVYHSDFGRTTSHSVWMVPGTWTGE